MDVFDMLRMDAPSYAHRGRATLLILPEPQTVTIGIRLHRDLTDELRRAFTGGLCLDLTVSPPRLSLASVATKVLDMGINGDGERELVRVPKYACAWTLSPAQAADARGRLASGCQWRLVIAMPSGAFVVDGTTRVMHYDPGPLGAEALDAAIAAMGGCRDGQ